PGTPGLRLRRERGTGGVPPPERSEAPVPRRLRTRSGRESPGGVRVRRDGGAHVVRPLPQGRPERDRQASARRACAGPVAAAHGVLQVAAEAARPHLLLRRQEDPVGAGVDRSYEGTLVTARAVRLADVKGYVSY